MHEAGAFIGRDVVIGHHPEGATRPLLGKVREGGFVGPSDQIAAGQPGVDFQVAVGGKPLLGEVDVPARSGVLSLDVAQAGVDADGQIRRQGPGRGGPHGQIGVLVAQFQQHRDRRILHLHVVGARLEVRQRRLQGRGDRHDLVALVNQAAVPQRLDHPPEGLHVPSVHGLVVVVEVHPAAKAGDGLPPLGDVAPDDGPALVVVAGHPKLRHRLLGGHAQLLVDFVLDGQAVAVPAETAQHMAPLHGPVARHDVLDGARDDVAVVRQSGGEGRAVVENVRLFAFALVHGALKDPGALPKLKHFVLHPHKGEGARRCRRFRHGELKMREGDAF